MWIDAIDLRDFYATTLGRVARRAVRGRVRDMWPDTRGMRVLGIGYAAPYLDPFRSEAERVIAAMPAAQGVLPWPGEGAALSTLCDEAELPFADLSMDRVLLVHALECAEHVRPMMREIWRVLAGGGRLLVVAPNRRGIWARFERTPFGQGRPYSPGQLTRSLRESMFTPVRSRAALFVPPVTSRMLLSSAPALEKLGERWFRTFAGIILAEATKQTYAAQPESREKARRKAYVPITARRPEAP